MTDRECTPENRNYQPTIQVYIITPPPEKSVTVAYYKYFARVNNVIIVSKRSRAIIDFLNDLNLDYKIYEDVTLSYFRDLDILYLAETRNDEGIASLVSYSQKTGVPLSIYHLTAGRDLSLLPLKSIMERLRGPKGCDFDKKQTHNSLKPYLEEEAQEVLEAIDAASGRALQEELGDLLLQVIFHSQIAEENGTFRLEDVLRQIESKLIRRHPHVFGGEYNRNGSHFLSWEEIKRAEKHSAPNQKNEAKSEGSILDQVDTEKAPLLQAEKLQEKCRSLGFDWDTSEGAYQKFCEEVEELSEAYREGNQAELKEELGDLIFAIVNLARFLDLSPGESLQQTIDKFKQRFKFIEARVKEEKGNFNKYNLEELDKFWEEAKKRGI